MSGELEGSCARDPPPTTHDLLLRHTHGSHLLAVYFVLASFKPHWVSCVRMLLDSLLESFFFVKGGGFQPTGGVKKGEGILLCLEMTLFQRESLSFENIKIPEQTNVRLKRCFFLLYHTFLTADPNEDNTTPVFP